MVSADVFLPFFAPVVKQTKGVNRLTSFQQWWQGNPKKRGVFFFSYKTVVNYHFKEYKEIIYIITFTVTQNHRVRIKYWLLMY